MPFLCGIACMNTESSLREAKGVVAWIVLCHSRESGNPRLWDVIPWLDHGI